MTKPITSVGLMMLHEQGRIYLGDPVSKYIPEFKDLKVGAEGSELAKNQITIHDLLRHTSGLTYGLMGNSKIHQMYKEAGVGSYDQTLEEMVTKLSKLPLVSQPGTRWGDSRSTDVLGRVIEVVSGMSLDKYFQDRIFQPLKMNDTGFYVKPALISWTAKPGPKAKWPSHYPTAPPKALLGGEGLVSTAHDYMRFLQMLMNNGQLDGVQLLGKNTVEYMTSDHLGSSIPKKGPGYWLGEGTGFGLGFAVRENTGVVRVPGYVGDYAWMGAGGTSFLVSPSEKLCAIFMTQANDIGIAAYYSRLMKTLVMAAIVE
jgi:CubicO group peptidase (beta-lactamase class C family)